MSYKNWPKAQKLNWDGVSTARRGGALPRWLYFGEIIEAKRGLTGDAAKTPGAAKVSLTIAIGGSHGDLVDVGSRKSFIHLTFGEKALWKTKQLCEALGCEPPASTGEDDLDEFAETVLGETVWFILRESKNQQGQPDNENEAFIAEAEVDEVAEGMEPPSGGDEAPKASSKSARRSNGAAKANGRSAKAAEMDTDEDADDEAEDTDDDTDEDEAPEAEAAPEPRRRGRPPKDRSARR